MRRFPVLLVLCLSSAALCQRPGSALRLGGAAANDNNLWLINAGSRSPLENPNGSVSKLDLKAPGKAQHEFQKGYELYLKKDYSTAVERLTRAVTLYPKYVSAYNSLGSSYLKLSENEKARDAFAQAAGLDDHLPTTFVNLGCAYLALNDYAAAEKSIQKAAELAPMDLQLQTALAYGQYKNEHYEAAINTAHRVHAHKHDGAAMVHFYAAAAWQARGNYSAAENELNLLMKEDPKSPSAVQAKQVIEELKAEAAKPKEVEVATLQTSTKFVPSNDVSADPSLVPASVRLKMQEAKEAAQLAEAETANCDDCDTVDTSAPDTPPLAAGSMERSAPHAAEAGLTFHASTDEVAVFFAATEHGVSVTDLTAKDVRIRDAGKDPAVITGFRSEADLPLRLGLVIDTSESISKLFRYEQNAAVDFMSKTVTHNDDLAFVVGFSFSVLMVQNFTSDPKQISHAVEQLAPAGGTSLWDAVSFSAEKLASHPETGPVARILVVISDGADNSSSATAKEAIAAAQRAGVTVYTICFRENAAEENPSQVGEHALQTLASLTGGALFHPGALHGLRGSFEDLQQVIRSRYLVTYKPALFQRDGHYRAIEIQAKKDGRKLRVFARKGYFASEAPTIDDAP